MDSPPSKAVPPDCPQQNNRSSQTKHHSHTRSPPAADDSPCCRLRPFRNCLCHNACIWRTAWTLPVQSNKMRQQLVKSLQEGEMTPLPLKKNRRNGCQVKTIQVHCICRMLNSLGTTFMHDWPLIRVRETPVYASSGGPLTVRGDCLRHCGWSQGGPIILPWTVQVNQFLGGPLIV